MSDIMNTKKIIPPKIRKHLSADALLSTVYVNFTNINDHRKNPDIPLEDALMSGFAVFSLKDPSLLAFDGRRRSCDPNLHNIYKIGTVPSDTLMREILDEVDPNTIGSTFKDIFAKLQKGKALEPFVYMDDCYLLSIDGTGYFSSGTVNSGACMIKKNKKTGKITYYQQMLGGAIVHPDFKEVIPLNPEMIIKQDGETKK